MTEQDLIKANELKAEINELEDFIYTANKVWKGKLIRKDAIFIFKSNAYGVFNSKEFNMNTNIKNKVINVLEEYLEELKEELRSV